MRRIRNFYYSRYRQGAKTVISHEVESFPVIEHLLLAVQPKLIIELGTFYCGLTALLHETDRTTEIHTFDFRNMMKHPELAKKSITKDELAEFKRKVFGDRVHFHIGDIISRPNQTLIDLLNRPEKKLLYCDNGNKIKEVNTYASYLREDDLIGVHDWGFEIGYENEGIRNTLKPFSDLAKINKLLEQRACSSRFFVRRFECAV
jgi:hypothetical protein